MKIRIAVAVDEKGQWAASGWSDADDEMMKDAAGECDFEGAVKEYWVEAEIDPPVPETIRGRVSEQSEKGESGE